MAFAAKEAPLYRFPESALKINDRETSKYHQISRLTAKY